LHPFTVAPGNTLHFTLVSVVAATALRASEVLSLRWADIVWEERKIRIVKSWKKSGVDGGTKTPSSERDVPMSKVLNHYLREWHKQNAIRESRGLRISVNEGRRQGADLCVGILRRPLTACGESCERDHSRWTSVGSA
jgi:integrase